MSAREVIRRYDKLYGDRSTWETHWKEISEVVLPRQSQSFFAPPRQNTKGEKRTEKMYDASAAIALERFASVMESMLTPMHQKWHSLRATDSALNKIHRVRQYHEEVDRILWNERRRSRANFQSQQFENYMGLGAFGTGAMWIDAHDQGGLRYRSVHIAEVLFDVNHQGIVDTAYRKFPLTARQIMQRARLGRFFEEAIPKEVTDAAEKNPDELFDVIHCVQPRDFDEEPNEKSDDVFNGDDLTGKNMPFESVYVLVNGEVELSEGGFESFPYAVSRYVTTPGELYGRSPAMTALPSIKVLNEQKKTMLKQGHRVVDPVLLIHDDGMLDQISLKPGAQNFGGVSADGRSLVQTLPTGNLAAGQELMDMEKAVINDVFLVSIFKILVDNRGKTPPTATEVLELAKEKGSLLSPTMGRQQSEMLGPMIERELDLLAKQGMIPDPPPELIEAGAEYEIEYESPLSRAQRAEEASGLFRTIEFATAHANVTQDPSAFDFIDIDKAMPAVMDINGVPASWQRSLEEVQAIRQGRNQQAQAQQMIDAAPAAAGILKAVQ